MVSFLFHESSHVEAHASQNEKIDPAYVLHTTDLAEGNVAHVLANLTLIALQSHITHTHVVTHVICACYRPINNWHSFQR